MAVEMKNSQSSTESILDPNSPLLSKKFVGRYEVIRLLGRGAFGTVKLGVDPINGQKVISFTF